MSLCIGAGCVAPGTDINQSFLLQRENIWKNGVTFVPSSLENSVILCPGLLIIRIML